MAMMIINVIFVFYFRKSNTPIHQRIVVLDSER
jgi:hypothetical protein